MVEAWTERLPFHIYLCNILYCTLPMFMLHLGIFIEYPVAMVLFIHLIIMYLVPFLIVREFKDSPLFRLHWKINRFEGAGSFLGILMGILMAGFIVFLYWMIDRVLGWDLHDHILRAPIPRNRLLEVISAVYLIIIAPFIEEWFWRRYNYHIFLKRELDYWLVSILWSLPFVVLAND